MNLFTTLKVLYYYMSKRDGRDKFFGFATYLITIDQYNSEGNGSFVQNNAS